MGENDFAVVVASFESGASSSVLLDSGCKPHNFISEEFAKSLRGIQWFSDDGVEGIFGDSTRWSTKDFVVVDVVIRAKCGIKSRACKKIKFYVLPELCVDVVIGARDIIFYNLTEIMVCQMEATLEEAGSAVASMAPLLEDLEEGAGGLQEAYPQQLPEVPANVVDDVISKDLQHMERASLKSVITTFIDCFGNELSRDTPCKIPPMQIEKLTELWDNTAKKALKQRVRRQCPEHYAEIDLQVRKLLQKNFIVACNEEYYSQVLLVRKSDLLSRFCIDYRYLNKVTGGFSWPIPDY